MASKAERFTGDRGYPTDERPAVGPGILKVLYRANETDVKYTGIRGNAVRVITEKLYGHVTWADAIISKNADRARPSAYGVVGVHFRLWPNPKFEGARV